ncbi:MAG: hypothetical protein NC097_02770 [Clostridium sp.]|nr:hypothetical protein [Prevotella sp.]MCM1428698.1 hypothetical protein [Clostridium sp.]MCM1475073.1 hypothetical protein [Muribaculaceae bacterium]
MITEEVIKEIYKKYKKPPKDSSELELDKYIKMLSVHHNIKTDGFEVVLEDLDEFDPFRRFLIRSLNAVLDFDKMVAFVFRNHILFLGKEGKAMRVHLKPEEKQSLFGRLFGN